MPCIRHSANKKHRNQHCWFDILPYTIEYSYHTVKRSDVYSAFTEWPFFNLFDYVYIDELCFWFMRMDIVMGIGSELITIGNKPMQIYPKVIQKF